MQKTSVKSVEILNQALNEQGKKGHTIYQQGLELTNTGNITCEYILNLLSFFLIQLESVILD